MAATNSPRTPGQAARLDMEDLVRTLRDGAPDDRAVRDALFDMAIVASWLRTGAEALIRITANGMSVQPAVDGPSVPPDADLEATLDRLHWLRNARRESHALVGSLADAWHAYGVDARSDKQAANRQLLHAVTHKDVEL